MSFDKAMNKMKFDTRLLEYNLSQGTITKEDYKKYLEQLEDCSHLIDIDTDDESDDQGGDDSTVESH